MMGKSECERKLEAMEDERDHWRNKAMEYKAERNDYRARATVFKAGFDIEGVVAQVRQLQEEIDDLRERLHRESPVEILRQKALPDIYNLVAGSMEDDLASEAEAVIVQAMKFSDGTERTFITLGTVAGDEKKAFEVIQKSIKQSLYDVHDYEISGDNFNYPVTEEEFLAIVKTLLVARADGHDAYIKKRREERLALWKRIDGDNRYGKGEYDVFSDQFDRKCHRSLRNVLQRLNP